MKAFTNCLWKGQRILYTFALLNIGWEGQTAVLEHFEDDEYSLLWKIGFCALSIWALLDFRIQFIELLNSVTDKNENKNPYTEVNTCTINDFLSTVLTWIKYNEAIRFQTFKMKHLEIKLIYCYWHVTNVTDSLFSTLSRILYLL